MSNQNQPKPGYKHTPFGLIPEDWRLEELQKVITLVNGRAFKPNEWRTTGLPIIRIQNLNDSNASYNYYDKTVEDRYYINPGDILFAWSGTKGVSFGARIWNNGVAILNQHIFKVLPKLSILTKPYSYLVLLRVQANIETKAHGFKSSFVHVKKFDLDKILLPIPPINEQEKIEKILSTWEAAITKTQQFIAQLQQRNKGLM
jgi:type I restriction enzyme S subunit